MFLLVLVTGLFQLTNGGGKLQLVVGYNLVTLGDSRTFAHGEGRLQLAVGVVNVKAGSGSINGGAMAISGGDGGSPVAPSIYTRNL